METRSNSGSGTERYPQSGETPSIVRRRWHTFRVPLLVVCLVAIAVAALRILMAPPRLPLWTFLPADADVYLFADLDALQSNPAVQWLLNDGPGIPESLGQGANVENETAEFVRATGFRYQDHLRELAAVRLNDNWTGLARIDANDEIRAKLQQYLASRATQTSEENSTKIYTFGGVRPLRMAILEGDTLAFSVGADAGLLSATMDRYQPGGGSKQDIMALFGPPSSDSTSGNLESTARRKMLDRPLWAVARVDRIFTAAEGDDTQRPSLGGFLLGDETLAGVDQLFLSVDSGPFTLQVEGEILCREVNVAGPLSEKLTLLVNLMRPRPPAPGSAERDYSAVWNAVAIEAKDSSVFIRWSPTPAMLGLVSGTKP